jgi:hypothetical protein
VHGCSTTGPTKLRYPSLSTYSPYDSCVAHHVFNNTMGTPSFEASQLYTGARRHHLPCPLISPLPVTAVAARLTCGDVIFASHASAEMGSTFDSGMDWGSFNIKVCTTGRDSTKRLGVSDASPCFAVPERVCNYAAATVSGLPGVSHARAASVAYRDRLQVITRLRRVRRKICVPRHWIPSSPRIDSL